MREFFKGRKRKAGVVTLGLACVFGLAWIRSLYFYENFEFRVHPMNCSVSGTSAWGRVSAGFAIGRHFPGYFDYNTMPAAEALEIEREQAKHAEDDSVPVFFGLFRFSEYGGGSLGGNSINYSGYSCCTYHIAVVLPLTMLSGYLLLSKPRPEKPTQPIDPDHA